MRVALELAATPGVPPGPNPRVGCVILDASGTILGRGFHRGAGTPHAEAVALADAGARARGATAVVTLEPCRHTGRTGPCVRALIDAGVARVVYAMADPTPVGGGAAELRDAGIDVVLSDDAVAGQAREFLRPWAFAHVEGRPYVTLKMATSLDGRIAASDGSSRWITGPEARRGVHELRAEVDAVVVGTGTALADDPTLSVRDAPSTRFQPLRVVMGQRALPPGARLLADSEGGAVVRLRTHDVLVALRELGDRGVRHILIEGGPTLAGAWLRADAVDRLVWFVAPVILGGGPSAVGDLGIPTLAQAPRWEVAEVCRVGDDAKIVAHRCERDLQEPG
jgi:diaminohydroxyphosphoribosylaminopyrimidine deaminase / 5-amino-6-(5-phosphoribosylamino)uracil reductase